MKKKLFFLSCLILLFATTTYAQMAIQGIARDQDYKARTGVTIPFKFSVYYISKVGTTFTPVSETISLTTDNFGVFSHILDLSAIDNASIFENELKLKIEQGTVTISDNKLNYVPYAVSASNGVPTGSIMPYMGTTAPKGWVLCNGAALPSAAAALKALIGDNAPDLRGMFMRGAGINGTNSKYAAALKGVQQDSIKSHLHAINLDTDLKGKHSHETSFRNDDFDGSRNSDGWGGGEFGLTADSRNWEGTVHTLTTNEKAEHNHKVFGDTGLNAGAPSETRPVNYGVNYIIKL